VYEERGPVHVISDFIHQAITNGEIRMMTDGEEERQLIHIDDVCYLWHKILSEKTKEIYDITSFEWYKIIDIANMIANMTGARVIKGKEKGKYQKNATIKKHPLWVQKVNLKDGLLKMINNYKKNV
jgi:nucleoside-diphosphate-sugar epimerase